MQSRIVGALIVLFVHILQTVSQQALGQKKDENVLRIASWNIQFLGAKEYRSSKTEQDPKDLADYIDNSQCDLLALQEITADDDAPAGYPAQFKTNKILHQTFKILNEKPGNDWKHVIFPPFKEGGDPKKENVQWVGIAWKSAKLEQKGEVLKIGVSNKKSSQNDYLWKRNAYAAMFSAGPGKTDFLVIPVHLKSNFKVMGVSDFSKQREEEIDELIAKKSEIEAKFPGEKDWVFIGDTNMRNKDEPGAQKLATLGLRDLNLKDFTTHIDLDKNPDPPFDRIFVAKDQPEFPALNQYVIRNYLKERNLMKSDFIRRFSDHLMVVTTVNVMKDDD